MRILIAMVGLSFAFFIGMNIPMNHSKRYALVQVMNGAHLTVTKNLSAVNCGFKKRMYPNGYCIVDQKNGKTIR